MTEELEDISDPNYDARKWEELRLLYSLVVDDIRHHKNEQTTYIYHTIGLYSVIVFLLSWLSRPQSENLEIRFALSTLSILVMLLGMWFVYTTQLDIYRGRKQIKMIYPQFTREFNDAQQGEEGDKAVAIISRHIYKLFQTILIVGELIVLFIIWYSVL